MGNADFHAGLAVFFKLNVHPGIQKQVLGREGFETAAGVPTREIGPGISIPTPLIPIAEGDNMKIEYVQERYL